MFALAVLALLAPAAPPSSRTPEELVERVQARFSAGSLEDFRAVYPFEDGLEPVRSALKHNQPRKPGLGRVLRNDGARAVLLLSGLAEIYFGAFDGKLAILSDHDNAGVSYMKGLWIFAMLEDILGPKAFDQAMTEFSRRSLEQPATWEVLLECLNRHSERDLRKFLVPWLEQASAPRLQTRIAGNRVTIVQAGPRFELPVEVEAETAGGRERRRVWLEGTETTVAFGTPVRTAALDPDRRLLLVR